MARRQVRGEGAQRAGSIAVGLGVLGLVGWLTVESVSTTPPRAPRPDASAEAGAADAAASAEGELDAGANGAAQDDADGGLFLPSLSLGDAGLLPTNGPRAVKIGVVLVQYSGAEGAPANARSKRDAQTAAERLLGEARADFHRAVGQGDPGSADDIGRITRGVLDPRTEAAVFSLQTGDVSEILETARGFWIVKRLD